LTGDSTSLLSRTNSYRFIYEPLDASGNVPLALGNQTVSAAGQSILAGNPFMAHLDIEKFSARNAGILPNQYKLAYDVNLSDGGKVNIPVSYIKTGGVWVTNAGTDTQANPNMNLIPPLQSFIVASASAATPALVANIKETTTSPADKFRSGTSNELRKLDITAIRGEQSSKTILLHQDDASINYIPVEDSYSLFPENTVKPVIIYTRSADGYALDINSIGGYDKTVPVGIRTSEKGNITLKFAGRESFGDRVNIYFHDAKTGEVVDLSFAGEYTFYKDTEDLYLDNRFFLSFSAPTGVNAPQSAIAVTGSSYGIDILSTDGSPIRGIRILDLQGKVLLDVTNVSSSYHYATNVAGIYFVRVTGTNGTEIRKITVK
jgi:hypothetical protein